MKVAHLTTVDLSLRYLLFPQLTAVVDAGGEVLGISAPGSFVDELEAAGIRHVPIRSSTRGVDPAADLRAAMQLWRVLREERPDILHTHNPKPGLYGRVLGRVAGVPLVVNTVHGLYATPDDRFVKRIFVYFLEAFASRFSDAELVQSREDLDLMARLRIAPRDRLRHLGNGVDLQRFDPDRFGVDHRREVRSDLGVRDDEIVVGMVGRLVSEKGYGELFEAAGKLPHHYRIICIGPDDPAKSDALSEFSLDQARAAGVLFLGMRTDIDRLYAAMDIFVLPSHREGFPRAAMEAAAMGVPVIASDIRGCREVVEHGENGLLVPARDVDALVTAIRYLGGDEPRRRAMSQAARKRALSLFDEQRVVDIVMETYRRLSRSRGLGLFDEADPTDVLIRPARHGDASAIAGLHAVSISSGFLPHLGRRFMTLLYRTMIASTEAVVLVADDGKGPIGFVAGVADTGSFYRRFILRRGVVAILAVLPRLFQRGVARRAWETFRYGQQEGSTVVAELLAMALLPAVRGRGIGTRLGREFLSRFRDRGVMSIKVVVGAANHQAIAAYRKMGFAHESHLEVHSGEPSVEMTWSA